MANAEFLAHLDTTRYQGSEAQHAAITIGRRTFPPLTVTSGGRRNAPSQTRTFLVILVTHFGGVARRQRLVVGIVPGDPATGTGIGGKGN